MACLHGKLFALGPLGGSMLISAGCTFFLFMSFSQAAIIAWQCLFCGVSVAAWNGIEVITVELYPASKRYYSTQNSSVIKKRALFVNESLLDMKLHYCKFRSSKSPIFLCRTTAFGLLNALCKLAAILGSSIFASFVGITKVIPILLSFGALLGGGLLALKLPETRQKVLL